MEGIYLFFCNIYTFHKKGIYLSDKNIILSKQKVYTFLGKSIYFSPKKYILFFRKK